MATQPAGSGPRRTAAAGGDCHGLGMYWSVTDSGSVPSAPATSAVYLLSLSASPTERSYSQTPPSPCTIRSKTTTLAVTFASPFGRLVISCVRRPMTSSVLRVSTGSCRADGPRERRRPARDRTSPRAVCGRRWPTGGSGELERAFVFDDELALALRVDLDHPLLYPVQVELRAHHGHALDLHPGEEPPDLTGERPFDLRAQPQHGRALLRDVGVGSETVRAGRITRVHHDNTRGVEPRHGRLATGEQQLIEVRVRAIAWGHPTVSAAGVAAT